MTLPSKVQFVVKISKLCNLRCRYCYEFEQLGNSARMSLEELERIYQNISGWYRALDPPATLEFVWHGGEPILIPPDVYWKTLEAQKRIFGETPLPIRNVIQTNLTLLDDQRIHLLRDGFDGVGVSIDLFGGLRVNAGGVDSVKKALANMDRLRAAGVDYGCITVLSKANLDSVQKIVRFYHQLKPASVRFLPLFDGATKDQNAGFEVTREEMLGGLKAIFDELLALDSPLHVEPIRQMINQVAHRHVPGASPNRYDKRTWEPVYVLDLAGDLYSYADAYQPEFCHVNLLESPMETMATSAGHLRAVESAEARLAAVCGKCRFYGSCDGYAIGEEEPRQKMSYGDLDCVVWKGMLEHIEARLLEQGVIDPVTRTLRFERAHTAFKHFENLPLQADVRVHFPDAAEEERAGRLSLSSGTTQRVEKPADGLSYLSAAIVPRAPWRPPTAEEAARLLAPRAPERWRVGADVAVVRIPDDVIEPMEQIFEDFGTREKLDRERYRDHSTHPRWEHAYQLLIDHLDRRFSIRDHEPTVVRLQTAPPGMSTVTKDTVVNSKDHAYVGLHLDTWEKIAIEQRHTARNRICVNLGREERRFLFINLTLAKMFEALGRDLTTNKDYYGTDLGHDFMLAYPSYPVLRLTVKPREAYIAPTDNLIHDGTSVDKLYPDIALHILGYFGLAQEAVALPVG
jgi:uncharacterized protein